jgi:hypothetical protein
LFRNAEKTALFARLENVKGNLKNQQKDFGCQRFLQRFISRVKGQSSLNFGQKHRYKEKTITIKQFAQSIVGIDTNSESEKESDVPENS